MVGSVVLHDDLATYIDQISSGNKPTRLGVDLDVRLQIDIAGSPQDVAHHGFARTLGSGIHVIDNFPHPSNTVTTSQAMRPMSQKVLSEQTSAEEVVGYGNELLVAQVHCQVDHHAHR